MDGAWVGWGRVVDGAPTCVGIQSAAGLRAPSEAYQTLPAIGFTLLDNELIDFSLSTLGRVGGSRKS